MVTEGIAACRLAVLLHSLPFGLGRPRGGRAACSLTVNPVYFPQHAICRRLVFVFLLTQLRSDVIARSVETLLIWLEQTHMQHCHASRTTAWSLRGHLESEWSDWRMNEQTASCYTLGHKICWGHWEAVVLNEEKKRNALEELWDSNTRIKKWRIYDFILAGTTRTNEPQTRAAACSYPVWQICKLSSFTFLHQSVEPTWKHFQSRRLVNKSPSYVPCGCAQGHWHCKTILIGTKTCQVCCLILRRYRHNTLKVTPSFLTVTNVLREHPESRNNI